MKSSSHGRHPLALDLLSDIRIQEWPSHSRECRGSRLVKLWCEKPSCTTSVFHWHQQLVLGALRPEGIVRSSKEELRVSTRFLDRSLHCSVRFQSNAEASACDECPSGRLAEGWGGHEEGGAHKWERRRWEGYLHRRHTHTHTLLAGCSRPWRQAQPSGLRCKWSSRKMLFYRHCSSLVQVLTHMASWRRDAGHNVQQALDGGELIALLGALFFKILTKLADKSVSKIVRHIEILVLLGENGVTMSGHSIKVLAQSSRDAGTWLNMQSLLVCSIAAMGANLLACQPASKGTYASASGTTQCITCGVPTTESNRESERERKRFAEPWAFKRPLHTESSDGLACFRWNGNQLEQCVGRGSIPFELLLILLGTAGRRCPLLPNLGTHVYLLLGAKCHNAGFHAFLECLVAHCVTCCLHEEAKMHWHATTGTAYWHAADPLADLHTHAWNMNS